MTSAEFKALRPEFASSSYDTRIATLLDNLPELDEERAGNELNMALSAWVAWRLARQDFAITFGAGATLGSSNTVEKKVGDVSIKRSSSNTSSSTSGGGTGRAPGSYEGEWLDFLREFGMGAVAVGIPECPVVT